MLKFKGLKFNFYGYSEVTCRREFRPLYTLSVADAIYRFGIQMIGQGCKNVEQVAADERDIHSLYELCAFYQFVGDAICECQLP